MRSILFAAVAATCLATPTLAQQPPAGAPDAKMMEMHQKMMQQKGGMEMMKQKGGMDHSMHGKSAATAASTNPSTAAFEAANAKMHQDMAIKFTGDADIDFVKGMIPHHQGAIDMAKVEIGFGKDPEIRKLAEEVIAAQEKEIAMMREWLKKKGQ